MKVTELQPGDEIICYMRTGLALEVAITGKGAPYRYVPKKPQPASISALTRFTGIVINNNLVDNVLRVQTAQLNSQKIYSNAEPVLVADIHYSAFKKVQILSKVNFEPENPYVGRPTKYEGLGTKRKPYRTLEEVKLDW